MEGNEKQGFLVRRIAYRKRTFSKMDRRKH
jgi:hypothetical protein